MTIPIVYEDAHVLAVNKPAGLAVHKVSPTDPQETLADILVRERPYLAQVGERPEQGSISGNLRPGIVHRLDKDTSGIMLVAKDQPTFLYLKNLFQTRQIKKYYVALVRGCPKDATGVIAFPLGKIGARQTTRISGKKELVRRDAVTEYEVIKSYRDYSLVSVMPRTGRTHQIRAHMKSIGCPVAGDPIYGEHKSVPAGLNRLFLHAQRLEFTTPDGKALSLETDMPRSLQKVLDALQ